MATSAPVFPVFVKTEFKDDGTARSAFLRDVDQIVNSGKRRFREFGEEAQRELARAVTLPGGGEIKFGFNLSALRQGAAEASNALEKLRVARDAAQKLAGSTGDTSEETRRYVQALSAQVIEAERAKHTADALVVTYTRLQGEIDRTVASHTRLAQSYRETFAEQARAENMAFRSQRDVNSRISPTLAGERATSNGAGFAALEEYARGQERAEAAMAKYAAEATSLRAALDPAIAVQQRFDAELAQAKRLLDAGAISTKEYAAAQSLARQNLQTSWAALTANKDAAAASARANEMLASSYRGARMAGIGAGQQLQDIAISLQGGQRATTVFAQQLPQLTFALSALEGSTNKTAHRIGQFATTLSGPWGLALVGATMLVGPFIERLFGAEEQAKKAEDAFRTQAEKLDILKNSYDAVIKATDEYSRQQMNARAVTLDTNRAIARQVELNLIGAKAYLESLRGSLATAEAGAGQGKRTVLDPKTGKGVTVEGGNATTDALRKLVTDAEATVARMETAVSTTSFNVADELARRATDRAYDIRETYRGLRDEVGRTVKDQTEKTRRLTALYAEEKAALESLNKDRRASQADRQFGREINSAQARAIASGAGFRVTSDDRSYARQKQLYDAWIAQGRPADNPVAPPGRSSHNRGNALDIAFGAGVSPASIRKAFADEGVRLTKILKERGHFHVEWSTSGADRVVREANQVEQFGERAAESIARINSQFDDQPKLVDQAARATRDLDGIIADLEQRNIDGKFDPLIRSARDAQATVGSVVDRQIAKALADAEKQAGIQELILQGRDREAAAVQSVYGWQERTGTLLPAQLAAVRALAVAEYDRAEAAQKVQEVQSAYLDTSRALRSEIEGMFTGRKPDFGSIFRSLNARTLTDQLFGDIFADMDAWMKRNTALGRATSEFTDSTAAAGDALRALTADIALSHQQLMGASLEKDFDAAFSRRVANDNGATGPLLSVAAGAGLAAASGFGSDNIADGMRRAFAGQRSIMTMNPEAYFGRFSVEMAKRLTGSLDQTFGTQFFGRFDNVLGRTIYGNAVGGGLGAAVGGVQGLAGMAGLRGGAYKTLGDGLTGIAQGSMIAGIGNALGIGMSQTGAQIGGLMLGPIGGVVGGLLGGLFKQSKSKAAVVTGGANGPDITGYFGGTGGEYQRQADSLGQGVIEGLQRIADQLGGDPTGQFAVSIGVRDGKYKVNPTGGGTKASMGAIDFGEDQEAALRAAIRDAIKDGAILGMRAATNRLLQGGTDLDAQIQKAVDFESIFARLKGFKDPVGAAMDVLDKEFSRLKKIAEEAGEGMVELEELYGLERSKLLREIAERDTASLKGLLASLTTGDSGLSLRERQANAVAAYQPLEARVLAGDRTAYDAYAEAAQTLLDIERQLYGSQSQYFQRHQSIRELTQRTIDQQTDLAALAANRDTPFSGSAVPAIDNSSVVAAIDGQTNALVAALTSQGMTLDALNRNVGTLIEQGRAANTGDPALWWRPASNF